MTTAANGTRRIWFRALIGILALSGVVTALIVAFGAFDSVAFSLVWRVFVADLYLVAAFAAQHVWLRRAVWIGAAATFVLGVVNAFWPYTPYYEWADGRNTYTVGDPSTGWSPWFGFNDDLEFACNVIVIGLVALSFVSFAYRWIVEVRALRITYLATYICGLAFLIVTALRICDSPHRWNLGDDLGRTQAVLIILALTAAVIVCISAFVQRNAWRAAQRGAAVVPADGAAPVAATTGVGVAAGAAALLPGTPAADASSATARLPAGLTEAELRALVRSYVDEYLREGEAPPPASD